MPTASAVTAERKPEARSRITNGKTPFLPGVDGRSARARRFRDVYASLMVQLEAIGPVSVRQQEVAADMASLRLELDEQRTRQAAGEPIDLAVFTTAMNSYQRSALRLGLELRPRRHQKPSKLDRMLDGAAP